MSIEVVNDVKVTGVAEGEGAATLTASALYGSQSQRSHYVKFIGKKTEAQGS